MLSAEIRLLYRATSSFRRSWSLPKWGVQALTAWSLHRIRVISSCCGIEKTVPVGYRLLNTRHPKEPFKRVSLKTYPCFLKNRKTFVFSQFQRLPSVAKVKTAPRRPYWTVGARKENALFGSSNTVWHQRSSHASASSKIYCRSASLSGILRGRQRKPYPSVVYTVSFRFAFSVRWTTQSLI